MATSAEEPVFPDAYRTADPEEVRPSLEGPLATVYPMPASSRHKWAILVLIGLFVGLPALVGVVSML
ncbi:hypothetical protein [Hoyosella subflava]|uniref:Uncharacterized protein n=1 Tax=Hoyosella subflava (strain DSM 45089 / JCM 17490 / NBRC 109087 / DQS3-9A1) TaxID=443218 RepID=F6ERJ3_HOYSD|nr:hypothetical protein [Hoyosella subflava]AEF38513.1 hypothetical protein AS9A_0053 [Hoyosella subflava DQS3-9A1]